MGRGNGSRWMLLVHGGGSRDVGMGGLMMQIGHGWHDMSDIFQWFIHCNDSL